MPSRRFSYSSGPIFHFHPQGSLMEKAMKKLTTAIAAVTMVVGLTTLAGGQSRPTSNPEGVYCPGTMERARSIADCRPSATKDEGKKARAQGKKKRP